MSVLSSEYLAVVMDLADFLQVEVDRTSLRDVAGKIKISKTTVDNIAKRRNKDLPELETLQKIAAAYNKDLWEVIEMANVDLGLPKTLEEEAKRLTALADRNPEYRPLVEGILKLRPQHVRAVRAYLEHLEGLEGEGGGA
jgi:transcriptional regulator with XRE-family HTH domain